MANFTKTMSLEDPVLCLSSMGGSVNRTGLIYEAFLVGGMKREKPCCLLSVGIHPPQTASSGSKVF